ncbi:5637_t:CDS:2, partial [Ambispora leptoticha]
QKKLQKLMAQKGQASPRVHFFHITPPTERNSKYQAKEVYEENARAFDTWEEALNEVKRRLKEVERLDTLWFMMNSDDLISTKNRGSTKPSEILIPQENKAQIEEIREIENKELEPQKKEFENKESKSTVATVAENAKVAVIPTVHASDKDDDDHDFEAKIVDR